MLWVQKHKPELEHIPHDTKPLYEFASNYPKQKKKALLLWGPTGTGKTAAAYALAKRLGFELIEVNASDYRNADEINSKIGNALKQQSLFSHGKIILVDEIDGIAGNEDRGGISALADLISESKFPIILTANDPWDSKFNTLRTKSTMIEFPAVNMAKMVPALQRILDKEKIISEDIILKTLARRSGGDLRGAITDMQMLAQSGALTTRGLETLHDREHSESIMQALVKILKSTDPQVAVTALDLVDEDIDEAFLWIDENLPKEYTNKQDLARAYEALSKADIYRGRIRRWQYWRYLAYVDVLITAGVAVAKDKKSTAFVSYGRTQRLLKIWMANQKYNRRKRVAGKLAVATHCSTKKALQETLPYVHRLYQLKHTSTEAITRELKLDEEELEWLNK
ncbi:MAG: replication factor C large subunit [Candidatus Woesearchaeota archaeon]